MYDARGVRTTLDIEDDVLQTVKELAENRGSTAGKVLSDLARQALAPRRVAKTRNGVPLIPRRPAGSKLPTLRVVNRLRDES
jgi:hypothetical protein